MKPNEFRNCFMKSILNPTCLLALTLVAAPCVFGQGTAFTYQGRLDSAGNPASGSYDFRFKLYLDPFGNTQFGTSFLTNDISVSGGLFTVPIDFGSGVFTGTNFWLEVDVRTNGAGSYTVLAPLQALTPAPYAIMAGSASNLLGTLPAAQLSGTYSNAVTFTNGANTFSGTFSGSFTGSGSGLADIWHTGGNLGTTATTNFLGTTDNQPLELHVNATRVLRLEPDSRGLSAGNLIGGFIANAVVQPGSGGDVIAGGGWSGGANLIYSNSSGVFIGAGSVNSVGPNVSDSVIVGGYGHIVQSSDSAIVGGYANTIQAGSGSSVIAGGYYNTIQSNNQVAFIGSGNSNTIQANAYGAIIGGGNASVIQTNADHSIIAGGWQNAIQYWAYESVISGGELNAIGPFAQWSVIGGGEYNTNSAPYSAIGGGYDNAIQTNSQTAFIGAGNYNAIQANANAAVIGGGVANVIQPNSWFSFIGGGYSNTAAGYAATIGGGRGNSTSTDAYPTVGGGVDNYSGPAATVAGGANNTANGYIAAIGGGYRNTNGGPYSTLAGGSNNLVTVSATNATIGGGTLNTASGDGATVSGGILNTSSGNYASVPGGASNAASGNFSFAAGQRAKAASQGAFVWADSQAADFSSTTNDQFIVRAQGGVGINTNNPQSALHVNGTLTADALRAPGAGVGTGTFAFIQRAVSTNVAVEQTIIHNPLTDNDPNAIVVVTHNWTMDTNSVTRFSTNVVGVFYSSPHWVIFNEDQSPMALGRAFNVLVIKP
jgi:hypothetical protein